jgi:hypothetical protein
MTIEPWLQKLLLEFVLFWVPAACLLLWLKFRKTQSPIIYFVSSANLVCYLLWLGAMVILHSPNFYRWYSEFKDLYFVPAFVVFILPFVAVFASFILLIACLVLRPREQLFLAPANLLLLILWGSSITWPN